MAAASNPFESYLKRANHLFDSGDIVQAGQIWQAILKKKPDHEIARAGLYKVKLYFDARATQDGLVSQKPTAETREAQTTQGAQPNSRDPEIMRLLEQGCTLYDAGHVEDALTRWLEVLGKEPDNVLAKGYISGARRTLRQPLSEEGAPATVSPTSEPPASVPISAASSEPAVDCDRLLRDGCTLFDMGQLEDALKKWEQILAHDPGHSLARAYVQDARKDLGLPPLEESAQPVFIPGGPVTMEPTQVAGAEDERLDSLIRDGVQLYDLGMLQEASQKWQQALVRVPGHQDAEAYLAMAKRDLEVPVVHPIPTPPSSELSGRDFPGLQPGIPQSAIAPMAPLELALEEPSVAGESTPVTPPPTLISGAHKLRKGLNLPELLQGISLPSWMASPAFILGTIAGLVILVIGTFYFLQNRKDQALNRTVATFKINAVTPVARHSEIASLQQSPEEIQTEAQSALADDPLLAYLRAKEILRLNPGDAASSQVLDRAKALLAKAVAPKATLGDFEKQFQGGDLDTAERTMTTLLSQNPDDRILRERASRLYGAMIQAYASKEQWTEAETRLRRVRAMFPEDQTWSVKLLLLARIQTLPRDERASWIQLLG